MALLVASTADENPADHSMPSIRSIRSRTLLVTPAPASARTTMERVPAESMDPEHLLLSTDGASCGEHHSEDHPDHHHDRDDGRDRLRSCGSCRLADHGADHSGCFHVAGRCDLRGMGDDDHGVPGGGVHAQCIDDERTRGGIEVSRRFVCEQYRRLRQKGSTQGDSLGLPSRNLPRLAMRRHVHSEPVQELRSPPLGLFFEAPSCRAQFR